jgi:hypothetical protein
MILISVRMKNLYFDVIVICGMFVLLNSGQVTDNIDDADARYYWLSSLKQLCLHADCLQRSTSDEELFVKHCLKFLLMPRSNIMHIYALRILYCLIHEQETFH